MSISEYALSRAIALRDEQEAIMKCMTSLIEIMRKGYDDDRRYIIVGDLVIDGVVGSVDIRSDRDDVTTDSRVSQGRKIHAHINRFASRTRAGRGG